jgi:hypothetical protein
MNPMGWKVRLAAWLVPGMFVEVDRLRWMSEANFDLHICPIPYSEGSLQIAFENVRNMEQAMMEGKATIQDRQTSLMEIYRRAIQCQT